MSQAVRGVALPEDPAEALAAYDGPWSPAQAAHLLRRALGGYSPLELAECVALSPSHAVDRLFIHGDSAVERGWAHTGATLARGGGREDLAAWWIMKLVSDQRATGSRLALFLHDHFACTQSKVEDLGALLDQHQLFVRHGSGPFGSLLREVLRGPAMLRFLDGDKNRRSAPNENLAREVLELFTLGVGHYSEQDVKEAARALTGWTIRAGAFQMVADHHDPREKHVLGTAIQVGDDLCQVATSSARCATFLADKVWRAYVSPEPPPEVLARVVEQWGPELELGKLLKLLFHSKAFYSADAQRSLVKSPVEWVVGALRASGGHPNYRQAATACEEMGQKLFEPPGVQGWAGGEAWIHAAAWIARTRFASRHASSLGAERIQELFAESGGGVLSRLFGKASEGNDVRRALELAGLGDLEHSCAAALRTAVPAHDSATDHRRDLIHAALCLPEAHLS